MREKAWILQRESLISGERETDGDKKLMLARERLVKKDLVYTTSSFFNVSIYQSVNLLLAFTLVYSTENITALVLLTTFFTAFSAPPA